MPSSDLFYAQLTLESQVQAPTLIQTQAPAPRAAVLAVIEADEDKVINTQTHVVFSLSKINNEFLPIVRFTKKHTP